MSYQDGNPRLIQYGTHRPTKEKPPLLPLCVGGLDNQVTFKSLCLRKEDLAGWSLAGADLPSLRADTLP